MVLARPVSRVGKSGLAVKIAMRLNAGGEIVPEPVPTRLSVFFETEEQTGLHVHVHGPFQLTDSRANIKRDDTWNAHVVDQLATLLAESLPTLRDRGSINRGFLEVLPNAGDELTEPWERLRTAAISAFREHPLVPAQFGGFVRAGEAVRGPTDIRDFLHDQGLAAFAGLHRRWVMGALRSGRAEAFLASLKIADWGSAELLTAFELAFRPKYYHSRSDMVTAQAACEWFDALDDEMVQRFYLLIDGSLRAQRRAISPNLAFVRLENGGRATAGNALLPPPTSPMDEEAAAHGIVLVRAALLRGGRGRGKEVDQFLRRVGVKEIGEREFLQAILRANYADGAPAPTVERHMHHMRRILRWHAEHGEASLMKNVAFLRIDGAEGYYSPDTVFLDQPYVPTGLSQIYDGRVRCRTRRPLWSGYIRLKREQLLGLLQELGVEDALTIERTSISYNHPYYRELTRGFGSVRHTNSGHDVDYTIPQLVDLLARRNAEISKVIWKTVAVTGAHTMSASFTPNQTHDSHRAPSTLALALREIAWVPAKGRDIASSIRHNRRRVGDGVVYHRQ
jgi:hypothetical protein